MNMTKTTIKQLCLYAVGLFILSFGVSLSITANLGVSPVSSLSLALSLTSGIAVGATTVLAHMLFIIIQVLISKKFDLKNALVQLVIAFLFGFFIDTALVLIQFLPAPETAILQWTYLLLSLFLVAFGLFGYSNAGLTLMPYDELTNTISREYRMLFSKAKIIGDVANVIVAAVICLVFLKSFGSIGIGTVIASLFIGKIVGFFNKHFIIKLKQWVFKDNTDLTEPLQDTVAAQQEESLPS